MKAHERFRLHVPEGDAADGAGAVIVAFIANTLVAVAKTVAAIMTGSSSLRTEALHSWVDTGNEVFVIAASRTARKAADDKHALGYGRESYVWSMFASLGMLALGAVVGVYQGIRQLGEPDVGAHYGIGYAVIAVSALLEGGSFVQTYLQLRKTADELDRDVFEHALKTSNSPMRAIFAEDLTALISLVIATLGLGLHQLTGVAAYDAAGSIVIGVLMLVTALILIARNGRFLAGKTLPDPQRANLVKAIRANPDIERVTFVYAEFIGPDRLLLLAGVGIAGDHTQAELATILRAVERKMMAYKYIGLAILTLAAADDADLGAESTT